MFSSILQRIMAPTVFDLISLSAVSLLITLAIFKGSKINTPLRGPRSPSFIFGHYRHIQEQNDPELVYEKWAKKYGPAYQVTGPFGSKRIVICDPKANAHFYSRETNGYVQTKLAHVFIENLFGRGVLWAEADSHKRQRKTLMPAFSNAAIRRLSTVFYDAVYKMKTSWDTTIDNAKAEYAVIDVQKWMNHVSLDSIGIGGFGHDFKALENKNTSVVEVFDSFDDANTDFFSRLIFFLGPVFPTLQNLPTKGNRMLRQLRETMGKIADELLKRSRRVSDEKEDSVIADKSIIGILVRSENAGTKLEMSSEEVLAQMNTLLVAGYATTSISLTWALIELSRAIEKQDKLRIEIAGLGGTDPTWEQLTSGLPYLNAVVHEVLRLHPPVGETTRVATEDDIIPFTSPIITSQGLPTDKLSITKGTIISSPIGYMNTSTTFWGPDAREFKPERWLEEDALCNLRAKEIQGHRHILTFSDGPRTCLGKTFALTEFKITLAVLIRHYLFELLDGPNTQIDKHPSILPRPKMRGYEGAVVPLKVRRIEGE
ncbi:hypothetical protein AGABI2DRAFT_123448 [Agaricus bisporus var. bisporus H97]|uniref:hypothetical protein n=1 Tax=Agaricus bisporus var. bisporus (strain H97 / ATCC MYA-4626 / FGSC 10389) TaxID=936046 RepID=UPI00029F65F1|nr:hypothetical protein AGABI2DRAFT_123448 [Agaricus bisporus var. bisporus H97]EKV41733.1 hypothetical protein AGABI2DRAFT_123448 [Agaricus bisporus var. bisporus H97]